MKKLAVVIITLVFVLGLLASCNRSICPAYASDQGSVQVENNG